MPVEQVAPLFGSARVAVLPYLAGYQSGVAHLAMTMGRPVVATTVGDLPSVVADGVTGATVPSGDPAALADAIEPLLDAALAERLGAAGRERVLEQSGWPVVAERVEQAFGDLVAAANGPILK